MHPLVFERNAELEAAAPPDALVVHDIPLLAETGRADTFDAVIVVDDARRGAGRADGARPRLDPRGRRVPDRRPGHAARTGCAIATYVIDNTGTPRGPPRPGRGGLRRARRDAGDRCGARRRSTPETVSTRSTRLGRVERSGRRSGGQVGVAEPAQLLQRLALELAHPLGGDAVLGADVGQLVLAAVDQAVARPDDVGGALVELLDQGVEPVAGLDVEDGQVRARARSPGPSGRPARCRRPRRPGSRG